MTYQEVILNRPDLKDIMEEYAGKMEFDNELTRENAEAETVKVMRERYLIFKQGHLFNGGRYERN